MKNKVTRTAIGALLAAGSLAAATAMPSAAATTYRGFATWFSGGGQVGACGTVVRDYEFGVALDYRMFSLSQCGRQVTVTNTANGRTVTATVVEAAPTTDTSQSLDLTPAAFNTIASPDSGQIQITWVFGPGPIFTTTPPPVYTTPPPKH